MPIGVSRYPSRHLALPRSTPRPPPSADRHAPREGRRSHDPHLARPRRGVARYPSYGGVRTKIGPRAHARPPVRAPLRRRSEERLRAAAPPSLRGYSPSHGRCAKATRDLRGSACCPRAPRRRDHQRHARHDTSTRIASRPRRVFARRRALRSPFDRGRGEPRRLGSSSTSPSCTCTATCSCPISPVGVASACRSSPTPARSSSPPTGSARCSRRRQRRPIAPRRCRSTPVSRSDTYGSSTPLPRRSKLATSRAGGGCSSAPGATTPGFENRAVRRLRARARGPMGEVGPQARGDGRWGQRGRGA